MSDDVLYLVFIIVLLIAMLAYMNIKERENNAKIAKLQNVIEDITKELHYFRKELGVKDDSEEDEDYKTSLLKEEIMIELDKQISSKITPVLRTLKTMEHIIEDFQNEQQNRLLN
ncbi:hypothetical protein ACTFTH_001931, partial [Campylobacter jejuni]